jgi:putative FmdB family regulatory protein
MIYDYKCSNCSTKSTRSVPCDDRDKQACECGAELKRIFTPTVNINIPGWFHDGAGTDALPQNDYERKVWEESGVRPA